MRSRDLLNSSYNPTLTMPVTSVTVSEDNQKKLDELISRVPELLLTLDDPQYDEIFGYRINSDDKEYVDVDVRDEILYKFLVASEYVVDTAADRIVATLNWRNKFNPLSAAYVEKFGLELDLLGVITNFKRDQLGLSVVTWNLYGNIKSPKKIFEQYGDDEGEDTGSPFLRWRIGLMERSLLFLKFTEEENNRAAQVHDYNNVSMFRMDPGMKVATKQIISLFGDHYPELLSVKFFINVPILMSWMFAAVKALGVVSADTAKKFQVMNGGDLIDWLGVQLPVAYGGTSAGELKELEADVKTVGIPEYAQQILGRAVEENNLTVE